jgi:hypothetical protein
MLAFTRRPPPDEVPPDRVELLLDADDDLVPLAHPAVAGAVTEPAPATARSNAPAAGVAGWAAVELRRFADAEEALLGWRHALFVVSGIRLRPSRTERTLRACVLLLLERLDSLTPDPAKEASS